MVFDTARFDLQPYVGFEMDRYVRRTFCSWEDLGWQSLMVQWFEHVPVVEDMALPGTADLHLVLPVSGRAEMETSGGGHAVRHPWVPGRIQLGIPHARGPAVPWRRNDAQCAGAHPSRHRRLGRRATGWRGGL
ncbi:hypothetical protein ACFTSF_06995 [Kribbella sp. NPDC056951]|uniref:hypothetical protein n=1 Tax=Kribbella sp. NPDC056951 TaxID=3345978 RepID=UPI00362A59FC